MKKILYVTPKENIEVSYPDWCDSLIKLIWKYLKIKTVKLPKRSGAKFKAVYYDEFSNSVSER